MYQQEQLIEYVVKKRTQGISDGEIRGKLLEAKLTNEKIDTLFAEANSRNQMFGQVEARDELKERTAPEAPLEAAPEKSQPTFPVHKSLNRFHMHVHANRMVWACLVLVVCAGLVGFVWWSKTHKEPKLAQATVSRHVDDPNYSVDLPIGWQATSDYKAGAGLTTFYNPKQRDASLVIYVLPFTKSSESSVAHTATEINALSQNGASAKVLGTESVQFGTTQGTVTTVLGSSARNPATEKSCYIFANVDFNNVAYNLDLSTSESGCQGNQLNALKTAITTFMPKATDLQYQKR